jgi:HEAT repeat protein
MDTVPARRKHPVYAQSVRLLPRRRPKIEKLKQAGDVEGLHAMLDGEPAVRAEAASALAAFDGTVAEDGLSRALSDPVREVRLAALEGLAARPSPIAVWPLLRAVAEWPYETEYAAIEKAFSTLIRWAPERAPEALARGLSYPAASQLDRRHREALTALLEADPRGQDRAAEAVAQELVGQLDPEDAAQTERAEEMLTWVGPAAADNVLGALDGDNPSPAAIRMAGVLRDARAVEPLVRLLGSTEPAVRSEAASSLGDLNDTRAVQFLMSATQDPDAEVRDRAAEALNTMGVAAVIAGVASVMRETIREQIAAAVEGDPNALEGVASAAVDKSLPAPEEPLDATPGHPPTWTQEVLARLLKRVGGQP